MTPAGTITKSRKNFPTMSYRAASTMLPIPLASFSPDFKASKVRNHMSLTQFAFILESILPHGFFTVKAFWQQTDSISRKTHRSAALQRTGGLLQLFPLVAGYHILTDFALEIWCPVLLIIWYIHIIQPIRWAVIKLLSAVITGGSCWLFVLLVCDCNYITKGGEMQPHSPAFFKSFIGRKVLDKSKITNRTN